MSPEAIELVLLHVWEMEGVGLPYFFFTRNCSEYLLEILSVGWPRLGRGGGFPPTHTPVDTLRAMQAIAPDAVGEPTLRASPATRLQEALGAMDREQANLVEALAAGRSGPDDPALDALAPEARGRVLVLAHDLLRHMVLARRIPAEVGRERSSRLLRARSRLGGRATPEPPITRLERVPPDRGHRTARVVAGGGIQDREGFVELRALPAFHTALDAPGGFAEGGEIRFLETAVRYYPELDRVRLHELVALDVTTASPWRRPFRPLAWHAQLGLRTRMVSKSRGRGLETTSIFRGRGGIGAATAPRRGLHLYAFGELAVEAGPGLEGNGAAGPLARVGASWSSAAGRFTLRAEGLAGGLFGEDAWASLRGELEGRVSLGRDWSLSASGAFDRAYDVGHFEGRIGLIRYF
jgi:hypothetical protein